MMNLILDDAKTRMNKALDSFKTQLDSVRSGRANPNLLNGLEVDYYGSPTPINQLAGISVQEGRIIVIKPYDRSVLKGIEHAINTSNLNLPPQSDGTVIRLTVPALTGETRKALCKDVKKMAESAKVAVRN
ncbi:MAG: ribosome recycling factor, partial [Erysipelotrichaceae bacterium]|nr:ribosome recycling factor [Erysipelotrichaceae bacterium]